MSGPEREELARMEGRLLDLAERKDHTTSRDLRRAARSIRMVLERETNGSGR